MPRLILASASPRRRELLGRICREFEVIPSQVPEIQRPGEPAESFARRAAREKAVDVAASRPGALVLGADTVVVLGERVLGKPASPEEALEMLRQLSGRAHRVITGVALVGAPALGITDLAVVSDVEFRVLDDEEIRAYVAGGEPMDKAGAYAIQGGAARFVVQFAGSYSNIVGLPVDEVGDLLARVTASGLCVGLEPV